MTSSVFVPPLQESAIFVCIVMDYYKLGKRRAQDN